jgi:hypothetical protein
VIISVDSTTQVTIGSTVGLSGAAIAGVEFTISQLPKFTILDSHYSEASYGTEDSFVYGVGRTGTDAAQETKYQLSHAGWVGVTTYNDQHGEMRVKSETLVAMSGIQTGNAPAYPGDAA